MSFWHPLSRPDPETLSPDEHGNSQKTKDAHQHAKNAKRLSSSDIMNPGANEERPGERNDRSHASDCHKTIACNALVGLNEVVEAN